MEQQERFVNDVEAAKILSVSPQSLRNWRHLGRGPAYSKKSRLVRYRVQDLLAGFRFSAGARKGGSSSGSQVELGNQKFFG